MEKVNQNGGMLTCFSIKVIREASIWPLGLCVQGRKTHLVGHMPFTHTHLAGVWSFIKLRWMLPDCGRKLERRPTQFRRGNVCKRYIGSKRKPKLSRQEATRLIPNKAWNPYSFRCPDGIHISCECPGTLDNLWSLAVTRISVFIIDVKETGALWIPDFWR